MSRTAYVNGDYVAEENAKVSIFDRGFLFGDGVYEVVPVIKGRLVDRDYFIERLTRSLAEMDLAWPCSPAEYMQVMEQMLIENDLEEGMVYSQVTRGVADRDFPYPDDTPSSLIAFTAELALLDHPKAQTGMHIITTPDLRWKRRDIKSINLLAQCMAKEDARRQQGDEGWMVEDGYVTEGVSSSAYIVKDQRIITRPLSNLILPGIRRRTLLEMTAVNGIEVEERLFTVEEALAADEAFISSATTLALPVTQIDGKPIGDGTPGSITMKLRELYVQRITEEADSQG